MTNWIDVDDKMKPPENRILNCYCPDWCNSSYQIAEWSGERFFYEDQPNNEFHDYVEQWTIFMEAN